MASTNKDPVLVILQLTGANDYLNTVVPYTNPHYWDARPKVNIPADQVLPINDELAFRSDMEQFKAIYDKGDMAIIHGIGFANSPRSHFLAMDICTPANQTRLGPTAGLPRLSGTWIPPAKTCLRESILGRDYLER